MNKDKIRKFIEEQMPNFKIVPSDADDESVNKFASADAPDVDVKSVSIDAWKKTAPNKTSSMSEGIDALRNQFRPRKLEGASGAEPSQQSGAPENTELQNLRSGKTAIVPVMPKNAPDDSPLEPQDLIVDEDEGIIGASS
jgi:hypothetical protein